MTETNRDYEHIRRRLEEERAALHEQVESPQIIDSDEADDGSGHHYADDGTEMFLRERDIALRNNAADLIAQIDGALARLNAGSYGICERCGQPIGAERLAARPYAAYCLECQAAIEQG